MIRSLLFLLLAFFSALPSIRAEVLVYAGTLRRTEPEDSYKALPLKCFVVTNPATGEVTIIAYGKFDGVKRREDRGIVPCDYYPLNRTDGVSFFDFYAYTVVDKSVGIRYKSVFLRGAQKTVTVNRVSGNLVQTQRAKTLKGSVRDFGGGFGYEYEETEVVATLDETRTIDVNVRARTVTQVSDELGNILESLGYALF